MIGVFTTSHDAETCDGCGNAIPAGDTHVLTWGAYVLTWTGRVEDVCRWHLDCHPAAVRVVRLRECAE